MGASIMEETALCKGCQREVPKTLYCIYCGVPLYKEVEEEESIEAIEEPLLEHLEPELTITTPPETTDIEEPILDEPEEPKIDASIEPDILQTMDDLKKNYVWKIKLCGMLSSMDVSEEVFKSLFEEYNGKIQQLDQIREEKNQYFQKEYDKARSQLDESTRKLEELRVRATIGQITMTELSSKTPEIEEKISELTTETDHLGAQVKRLEEILKDVSPKDIFELEKTTKQCLESIEILQEQGHIKQETVDELRGDLEKTLDVFDNVTGDKKARETELRDELEKLETRYKIEEVSIGEFESEKKRIISELENIWR